MLKYFVKLKNKFIEYRKQHSLWYIIKHTSSIVIGFVLSPLSWWNDLLINIPLAYVMTWAPLKLLAPVVEVDQTMFLIVFIFNYWVTNVVGIMMMHYSSKKLVNKKAKVNYRTDLLIAGVYTAGIAIFFYVNPGDLLAAANIIPQWVQ
ncbi:hypothetical protein ACFL2B_01345 [Patescibacteria group bacterium]